MTYNTVTALSVCMMQFGPDVCLLMNELYSEAFNNEADQGK